MRQIPIIVVNGVNRPSEPWDPLQVSAIVCDGEFFNIYELGEEPPVIDYGDNPEVLKDVKTESELVSLLKNPDDIIEFKKHYAQIMSKTVEDVSAIAAVLDAEKAAEAAPIDVQPGDTKPVK